ncbi:hypothetical protein BASA81_010420 [Batrachochytrium salamandrivorans]|nr:hypothetical protein BASA81_010420 [Batrachochytrium salamandrivorans]
MSKLSKWMTLTLRCRETTSADFKWRLRLGRETPTLKVVRKEMMNMEDGDGLDICERGDGARGMGVRGTEVVLAPRGEMGSFTQMPPTSLLCSHQPAISTLNNVSNPDPNFSDPSTSIFALSSLRKLLLPGTLRIGPFSHVGTFFVDCGADDILWTPNLAEELKVLYQTSNPITLRLADGDSSSTLTHQTAPQHTWKACGDSVVLRTSLCHGLLLGYSWLERHNPRINWVSRMVTLTRSTVWKTVPLDQLELRDLENLQQSTTFCLQIQIQWNLAFRTLLTWKKLTFWSSIYVDFRFYPFRCLPLPGCFSGLQLVGT